MRCAVITGVALLVLLPAARAQEDKKGGDDKVVLKTDGKLTQNDPKDKLLKKSPCKVHTVKLAVGWYIIDLKSDDFDAFLRLEDSKEKQLGMDDDSGGGLNSRLGFQVDKEGDYRVIAASLDSKTGSYQLAVRKATKEDVAKLDPFYEMIGKPAPELQGVFSLNGETKKLSDLKGKVVLVDFWAVWCGPCIQTFPHLNALDKEHKKEGLEILGVTTYFRQLGFDKEKGKLTKLDKAMNQDEENAMLKDFAAHYKLSYRLMAVSQDGWQKISKDYRVRGIPTAAVIDREGIVRMVRVGSGDANATAIHDEIRKLLKQK